jgi:hypothetical protein
MKNLLQGIICLSLMCICINTSAQKFPVKEPDTNRPSLFHQLPQQANCRINNLTALLSYSIGEEGNIQIADNLQFQGIVSSVASKYENTIKSVVVRSSNYPGASLTFSKITKDDGNTYFTGRIISFQHADAYEIVFEKGQYSFVKKGFYDLVND